MATKDNPHNSAAIQALLDLSGLGLGTTSIADAISRLNNDTELRQAAEATWNRHLYPNRKIVYVQMGIEQRILTLTDGELRVLTLLGMYAHQSGLIQIRRQHIAEACGISERETARALKGLCKCGAIRIEVERRRHEPNIYMVHPGLYNKGKRIPSDASTYEAELSPDQKTDLITQRDLPTILQTEAVRTEEYQYNRVTLVSKSDAIAASESAATAKNVRSHRLDNMRNGDIDEDEECLPWENVC